MHLPPDTLMVSTYDVMSLAETGSWKGQVEEAEGRKFSGSPPIL